MGFGIFLIVALVTLAVVLYFTVFRKRGAARPQNEGDPRERHRAALELERQRAQAQAARRTDTLGGGGGFGMGS